jgi:predicted dehydrogenase
MSSLDRRHFLGASAGAALSAATVAGAAQQPNQRVNLAVMGVRGRGRDLIRGFSAFDDVDITYLCEIDNSVVANALKSVNQRQKQAPRVETDIRRVLQDKTVTAIAIAAPDHWHALATIWACEAGKHVYVEKPVSHNLVEGRRMVEAARRHDRIVQVGTQRRSGASYQAAAEFVRSGKLGKVAFARACIAGNRPNIGHVKDSTVPKGVDYDLWLGPAPQRPFNQNRFHYKWHWNWDYGTAEIGNNGIHGLDLIRMLLNLDAPTRISAGGGKLFYDDDQQTPDTHVAVFDFPNTTVVWEHRIWSRTGFDGQSFAVALYGEYGTMICDGRGWRVIDAPRRISQGEREGDVERPHLRNFIDCVKQPRRPNADIEEGHKSTRLCHLGNIALRLGRTLRFDAKTETCTGDNEANALLRRTYRKPFMAQVLEK